MNIITNIKIRLIKEETEIRIFGFLFSIFKIVLVVGLITLLGFGFMKGTKAIEKYVNSPCINEYGEEWKIKSVGRIDNEPINNCCKYEKRLEDNKYIVDEICLALNDS